MATKEATEELIGLIQDKFELISATKIEDLLRDAELGSKLSFKIAEPIIVKAIELFKKVESVNLKEIPYNTLSNFHAQFGNALQMFGLFKSFDPNQNNPVGQRDALVTKFENQYEKYFQHALPILTVGLLLGNDLSVQQAKMDELISEFEINTKEANKSIKDYLDKIESTLKSAEDAAAKVGISKHSQVFKEEYESHDRKSTNWLKWSIGVLLTIIITSILFVIFFPDAGAGNSEIIQYTLTKIIILSTLFYALSLCNRNFKAHKHNAILNKHRQNALSTFETFTKAAGADSQTKNSVLMAATQTIFSNQQTGYLNREKETDSSNKIVEIIKSVSDKKD